MVVYKPKLQDNGVVVAVKNGTVWFTHPKQKWTSSYEVKDEVHKDMNRDILEFSSLEDCQNWCYSKNIISRI
jgi:hypothetical protein|tara:strand:+ start:2564 stop:2779 length:216 start_codon:yes stop_codon:yes gene_type:complete